jgi:hypothetical protein
MSDVADFNQLDRRLGLWFSCSLREYRDQVLTEAMRAGSVSRMSEPFRSWLSAESMTDIPNDALLPRFRHEEVPPAVAEGTP